MFIEMFLKMILYLKLKEGIQALTSQNGLGLATVGLVCNVVGVIIQTLLVLSFVLFATNTSVIV